MLPLFQIKPQSLVPSTLHIFMGVFFDTFNNIVEIAKNIGQKLKMNIVLEIDAILTQNKTDKKT